MLKLVAVSLVVAVSISCSGSGSNTSAKADTVPGTSTTAVPEGGTLARSTPTPGSESDARSTLAKNLVGTWKHVSIAKTPDGERQVLKYSSIAWTFEPEGTGTYVQTVRGVTRGSGTNEFKWKLDGDVIEIAPTRSGRAVTYTVVKRSENEMTWRNNTLGDYYIVERQ